MEIEGLTRQRYGWCSVGAGRHFRLLVAQCDRGMCCERCITYLKNIGYKLKAKEEPPKAAPRIRATTPRKRRGKQKHSEYTKKTSRKEINQEVITILAGGEVLNNEEILAKVRYTRSQAVLDLHLWMLKKSGEIVGRKASKTGKLYYQLPGKEHLIARKLQVYFQSDMLALLDEERELTVKQLAARMGRRRGTIEKWVRQLERSGQIVTEVRPIKGEPGLYKFCRRNYGEVNGSVGCGFGSSKESSSTRESEKIQSSS